MANYGTRYVKKKTPWAAFAFLLLFFLVLGYIISGLYVAPANLKGDYNAPKPPADGLKLCGIGCKRRHTEKTWKNI